MVKHLNVTVVTIHWWCYLFWPKTLPLLVLIYLMLSAVRFSCYTAHRTSPGLAFGHKKIWSIEPRFWWHGLPWFSSLCEKQQICAMANQRRHNLERKRERSHRNKLLLHFAWPRVTHTHTDTHSRQDDPLQLCRANAWGQKISAVNKTPLTAPYRHQCYFHILVFSFSLSVLYTNSLSFPPNPNASLCWLVWR